MKVTWKLLFRTDAVLDGGGRSGPARPDGPAGRRGDLQLRDCLADRGFALIAIAKWWDLQSACNETDDGEQVSDRQAYLAAGFTIIDAT